MTEKRYLWRMLFFAVVITAAWIGLGVRLAFLHFGHNERLVEKVRSLHHLEHEILVGRGRILDANGDLLALDLVVKDVCVDPQRVVGSGHADFISSRLAYILGLDPNKVLNSVYNPPGPKFAYVKRFVHRDVAERISRMKLEGVLLQDVYARYYPQGSLMSHVVGFSNQQGIGSAGIELRMNRFLKGRPGLRVSEKDGRRREVYARRTLDIPPQEGCDVHLTIDKNVQYIIENALDAAIEKQEAIGAWAIIQHVSTGRILAMASRPTFDPNEYRYASQEQMMNRPIGFTYEPGSTMKAAVIAAALNEAVVSPENTFDCEDGIWYFRGRPLRDYHPYGVLSVADILKKSSNIGTAKVAMQLGEERLDRYLREFGVGSYPGLDLPGEEPGILHDRSRWSTLSISRIPMGHEVAVTALHISNLFNTIANRGYRMKPYIVERVVNAEGAVVYQAEPEVMAQPIREDTARLMCRLLHRVTEDGGTARRARVDGYSVAGKTGTAEKLVDGHYSRSKNIASFVGFLPVGEPEITMVVVLDEPKTSRTGGGAAAPVFKDVASQVVRYLDIPAEGRTQQFVTHPAAEDGPTERTAPEDRSQRPVVIPSLAMVERSP